MIGVASTGRGFRALGRHLVERDPARVAWVETRNVLAEDLRGVWAEMEREVELSGSRVKEPVYYLSISFHPDDDPSESVVLGAADRTLLDLGLDGHQALIVRHDDTECARVHVMVNRVGADGRAWSRSHDGWRLRSSLEAQERELGVRRTGRNAERADAEDAGGGGGR